MHDYILIQKQRYEDQLTYAESIPEQLLEVMIPKLVIQPLIDNAIRYALERGIDDACSITVSACGTEDAVDITVSNSGSSFPEDMLGPLQPEQIRSHGLGIGLVNIYRRLQLTYGADSGLCLENTDGLAVCRLRIPRRQPGAGREEA